MKFIVFYCSLLLLIIQNITCEMTEKQLKAAVKMIRSVCQPKSKVSNEKIEAMQKGIFEEDRSLMCYMECCLRTGRLAKDGKFDLDLAMAQVQQLPEVRKQPTIETANHCKDASKSDDKCEAAFEVYKCAYEFNPENFFFP